MAQVNLELFKPYGESSNKNKIILCHTSRNLDEYLISLKYRLPAKYKKIPNYIISREGEVYKLLEDSQYTLFFKNDDFNQKSIVISLENLGWLEKIPLSQGYINWIGNIYKEPVFEKKWRDYLFWEPYTKAQLDIVPQLCKEICKHNSIDYQSIGHNVKIKMVEDASGIYCRANFDQLSTDLNPSFDFKVFNN